MRDHLASDPWEPKTWKCDSWPLSCSFKHLRLSIPLLTFLVFSINNNEFNSDYRTLPISLPKQMKQVAKGNHPSLPRSQTLYKHTFTVLLYWTVAWPPVMKVFTIYSRHIERRKKEPEKSVLHIKMAFHNRSVIINIQHTDTQTYTILTPFPEAIPHSRLTPLLLYMWAYNERIPFFLLTVRQTGYFWFFFCISFI